MLANLLVYAIIFFSILIPMVFITLGLSLLFSIPFMILWNWLMPSIFGLPSVGFFEAWGLLVISNMIFKSRRVNYKELIKEKISTKRSIY